MMTTVTGTKPLVPVTVPFLLPPSKHRYTPPLPENIYLLVPSTTLPGAGWLGLQCREVTCGPPSQAMGTLNPSA